MSSGLHFNESMILKINGQKEQGELLETLADKLYEEGYVKETYKEAILAREAVTPTGLFTGNINVAIPHTDCQHVNEDAIVVAVLNHPVTFARMDDPLKKIDVRLVVMLALSQPHGHIEMLQKVITLIQNQDALEDILAHSDRMDYVKSVITQYLM